jgi:hypothetical protein
MEGSTGKPRRPRQSTKPRTPRAKKVKENDGEKSPFRIKPEDGALVEGDHPRTPAMTHGNDSIMGSSPCTPTEGIRNVKSEPHEDGTTALGPISAPSQRLHSPGFVFDSPSLAMSMPEQVQNYVDLTGFLMDGTDDHSTQPHSVYHQPTMISGIHPNDIMGQGMTISNSHGQEFLQFSNPFEPLGRVDGRGQIGGHSQMSPHGMMTVKREDRWDDTFCQTYEAEEKVS